MKKWKLVLLVVVAAAVTGCDRPYLPGDFATELDMRIVELKAAEKVVDPECAKFLALDREYLETLKEASR